MRTITISDVTMKQPADQGGFALSFREKIEFAKLLDRLNVDVIEVSAIANRRVDTLLIKSIASAVREAAVAVPLALILSRRTAMPVLWMFTAVQALEIIKCTVGGVLVGQGRWIRDLTSYADRAQ